MLGIISKIYNLISKRQWLIYFIIFTIAFIVFIYITTPPNLLCPDGFYHTKMALLMKESGIVKDFPWTQFTTYKNLFVDHHFGYHFLLIPFLSIPTPKNLDTLSSQIDPLIKVKLASAFFAAFAIIAIYWLLRKLKIKLPVLWTLSSILTMNFMARMSLSRSPAFSLIVLILGFYFIVKKKYLGIFIISLLYVWTYGGWPIMLLCVLIYCSADAIKKLVEKQSIKFTLFLKSLFAHSNTKLLLSCFLGLLAGLIINPYFPKTFTFYWFQTVKIAILNYQNIIGVGAEWYAPKIFNFLLDALPILIPYIISMAWFVFWLKKQKTKEWFFALLSLLFLVYTLKARRIIEYLTPIIIIFNALIFTQIIKSINWSKIRKQIKHLFRSTENIFYFIAIIILSSVCIFFMGFYSIRGVYDLRQNYQNAHPINHLQGATQWIKKNVPAQEIIFHSNWDIFPELFYFDDSHYYINGLDQTFMYEYDQELYNYWRDLFIGKTNPNEMAKIIKEKFKTSYIISSKNKNDEKFAKLLKRSANLEKVYEDEQAIIYENNFIGEYITEQKLDLIAHAMGTVMTKKGEQIYTNSLEALLSSYEKGYKMFEVDLSLTKDNNVVASHEPTLNKTLEEFLNKKTDEAYSSLSLENLLKFMEEKNEIVLIIDIKSDFEKCTEIMIKKIKKYNYKLLDRIIPQAYSEKNIETLNKQYNFPRIIYALYRKRKIDLKNIYKINSKYPSVNTVSISITRISEFLIKELKKQNIKIYLHTLNDDEKILQYRKKGIDGIYTDSYYQDKNNI